MCLLETGKEGVGPRHQSREFIRVEVWVVGVRVVKEGSLGSLGSVLLPRLHRRDLVRHPGGERTPNKSWVDT